MAKAMATFMVVGLMLLCSVVALNKFSLMATLADGILHLAWTIDQLV